MDLKTATGFIDKAGPTADHRNAIAQSWFGSVVGQATTALLLILAYVIAVVLLYKFIGEDLTQFHQQRPYLFYGAFGAPLLLVAIFSVAPAILRDRRDQQLRPLSRSDAPRPAGYYRLHPYEHGDAERYVRHDDAVERALAWIENTPQCVLYLTGVSGAGKSSLVSAGLTPGLEASNWLVVGTRGMGAPLSVLTQTLQAIASKLPQPPAQTSDPLALSEAISNARRTMGLPPALIILDQFEEFLILDSGEDKNAYIAFLKDLDLHNPSGIRLLHVFREEYRPLLRKLDLPVYQPRLNAFELPRFTRWVAQDFLESGPVRMDPAGYEALFQGLDRIEEKPGLYRPITLNMVGSMLDRQGDALIGDPGRLIDRYLNDCISNGKSQDVAPPILLMLVTEGGTKEPQPQPLTENDIVASTRLANWQVRAALEDLADDGLVREIAAGLWEIRHVFIARLVVQILGRKKRPLLKRAIIPAILTVAAAGWVVAIALAVPFWANIHLLAREQGIRELQFTRLPSPTGTYIYKLQEPKLFSNNYLSQFGTLATGLSITHLDLSNADGVTDLSPLQGMPLHILNLSNADGVTDLSPLRGMPLNTLDLSFADGVTDLSPLRGMPLIALDLSNADGVTDLSPLQGMPLSILNLRNADGVTDLSPLQGMPLDTLNLRNADGVTDLSPLRGMRLNTLDLSFADGVTDLSPLRGMDVLILGASDALLRTLR